MRIISVIEKDLPNEYVILTDRTDDPINIVTHVLGPPIHDTRYITSWQIHDPDLHEWPLILPTNQPLSP